MRESTINTLISISSTEERERRKLLVLVIDSFIKNNPNVPEDDIKELMGAVMDYSHSRGEKSAFEVIKRDYIYE
ncbi:MAG: hypothetical protein ACRDD8_16410 [Bacteroidales bacterium]